MNCFFCNEPVEQKDFCYGCKAYICQECGDTYPEVPGGRHEPIAHLKLKAAIAKRDKWQKEVDRIEKGQSNE